MKIKIEGDKIVKAIQKLAGIEIVLGDVDDAREAVQLILRGTGLQEREGGRLRDVKVTPFQEYETSAVDYRRGFLLEFLFEDDVPPEARIKVIQELQTFFRDL